MEEYKKTIPAGLNERIMSAPPEFWETAKRYEPCNAYSASERKAMYPCPDKIFLMMSLQKSSTISVFGVTRFTQEKLHCQYSKPRFFLPATNHTSQKYGR